jgi:outer membrane cobalamin receptor
LCSAIILCCALVLGKTPLILAQEPPPEFELPDVVSPGRRVQPAAASPASVSVLTAEDLQRLGVRTVGEAIAFLPETIARPYGGPGGLISPSIRGSGAEQVLVLIDGVPVNSVLAGNVDLSTIPVDDVERIEVLRGPFSAIYGSGALGGVISIITRRHARPTAALGGGSFGGLSASATAGGDARLSLRYDASNGDRPNSDLRSGYLSLRLGSASTGHMWDLSLIGTASARGAPGTTFFPSLTARQDDSRVVAALTMASDRGDLTDRLRISMHLDGLTFRDPAFGTDARHDGATWGAEWQRVIRRSETHVVTLGLDASMQRLTSTSVGDHSSAVGALYLQDDRSLSPRLLLSAGLRVDTQSTYGVEVNPRLGLVYFVGPDVRLRLAAGRTFRAPTLADLYFPFDGFVRGNPLLRPEYAWSVDGGLEARVGPGLVARATLFWSDVRDLIIYVPDAFFVFSPENIGAASIRGGSLEVEGALSARWSVRASTTVMQASDGATGLDLPNRPQQTAALSLTRALPRGGSVTASAVLVGRRFADAANVVPLPAYVSTGLAVRVPMAPGLLARATIQNLFDARYEPVQGYPAPGRTVFVELVVQP